MDTDHAPARVLIRQLVLYFLRLGLLGFGGAYRVPDGHYFVLGDNRDNSRDSRFSDFGFIPAEDIAGKVMFVWWNTGDPHRAGIAVE